MFTAEDLVALIICAQEGNRDALERVMRAFETRLLPYLQRCLQRHGVTDQATAEALVQETLLRFLQSILRWKREKDNSGMAWVLTIAHRQMISFLRSRPNEF